MNHSGYSRLSAGPVLTELLVFGFLLLFLAVPVGTVFYSAFVNADGSLTTGHFGAFFNQPLMREAFFNSLYVAGWSALLASLIAGGLYLLGAPMFTVPFWAGLVYGYLWYDFLHWSTHHRKPLTAWCKKLRDHHMAHHFADPHKNFGLSHMWMDRLLGTTIKRDDK